MKKFERLTAVILVFVLTLLLSFTAFAEDAESVPVSTPRNETLYIGGLQSVKANNANPFSSVSQLMAQGQADNADCVVYETLYMYNMLNGELYPLLADGDPETDEERTCITVKLKEDAHWSDGSPLTTADVQATWQTHQKYKSTYGVDFGKYISAVEAVDELTVVIRANEKNYNFLKMEQYLHYLFVAQKEYLEAKSAEYGDDAEGFKNDGWWDAPHSGPYDITVHNDEKVLYERDDNYWGQAESMWVALPHPKYLCHNIYTGNDAQAVAFEAGEIDVNQQFMPNVWTYWEEKGLPISTYLYEPPYHLDAQMPSLYFNCQKEGLNQAVVRRALSMAIDYNQIIASAMSGYSYTFTEIPRSLFSPLNQDLYQKCCEITDLEALNFAGRDVEGAGIMLDEAGIIDTDGDGIREYNGINITARCECPAGFTDWNAALEIVAEAGREIGLGLETYFPETSVWNEDIQTGNFDIAMNSMGGVGVAQPWSGAYLGLYGWGGEFPERITNGYSRWYNEEADALLAEIPTLDPESERYVEAWARLNEIYLTECPNISLMYRPAYFHTVNETVWTGFPEADDGSDIPPTVCVGGYGIAALYNIVPIEE
ncbi:MAG: ABC transporter substrate-binding protein [Clostridia bacterium]|nr:ABC transporter substrate-binding protein [Clostridia bacterium]